MEVLYNIYIKLIKTVAVYSMLEASHIMLNRNKSVYMLLSCTSEKQHLEDIYSLENNLEAFRDYSFRQAALGCGARGRLQHSAKHFITHYTSEGYICFHNGIY